jgi:death-on-curing protein
MSREPLWIDASDALAFHAVLLAQFGGSDGLRDEALLESALARPRHRFAYESADLFELAATYAHGIAKNHPFVDGNKRTAFVVARVFLGINGLDLRAPEEEVVVMTLGLAEGSAELSTYAAWLRKHSRAAKRLAGLGTKRKPAPKRTASKRRR